jgi:hypothetical protein
VCVWIYIQFLAGVAGLAEGGRDVCVCVIDEEGLCATHSRPTEIKKLNATDDDNTRNLGQALTNDIIAI